MDSMKSGITDTLKLDRRVTLFRWLLLLIVAPIIFSLSDFHNNDTYLIYIILFYCGYNAILTIAMFRNDQRLQVINRYSVPIDIILISALLCARGGVRSDLYAAYFLVISYAGVKYAFKGLVVSLAETLVMFTIVAFGFTAPENFDIKRYFIRVIYITVFTLILYELNRHVREIRLKERAATDMAYNDALTGLPNRLSLSERFAQLVQRYRDTQEAFAIAMIDIDNFKKVNDTKGHIFGDKVLCMIAQLIKSSIGDEDYVCRFGGEEFLILFPNKEQALDKAQRICDTIKSHMSLVENITVSVGVSYFRDEYSMIENISFADQAMYTAKNNGRDNVAVC